MAVWQKECPVCQKTYRTEFPHQIYCKKACKKEFTASQGKKGRIASINERWMKTPAPISVSGYAQVKRATVPKYQPSHDLNMDVWSREMKQREEDASYERLL